ncbi:MAG: hypothetical protein ETSY1_25120 [Candidatus Entotheonella factor]|uniref:Uncharacterized protein n=1 Tax=Entotheonella factor TaxID=1429438 RepID=W4LGL3_ENTF1|nr:MAG: hypothetical protein ETSY1_25120 [Candidatus Entotheonella factor]
MSPNRQSGLGLPRSMAAVPDVNGDDIADLALGASAEDNRAGRVYVLSGADGTLLYTLNSPRPLEAEAFGQSVAGMTDLNADGLGDLIIGAIDGDPNGSIDTGRVYVYSAVDDLVIDEVVSPNPEPFGQFGFAVASVPDYDGDETSDFVVGAPHERAFNSRNELIITGRAYVFSGATRNLLLDPTPLNPLICIRSCGDIWGSGFGYAVAGLPDADGDGRGEVLIGAPGEWTDAIVRDGRLYVFYSSRPENPDYYRSLAPESRGFFGYSIAGLSDINGDGSGDILVSAANESAQSFRDGQAHLLNGADGQALRRWGSPNANRFGRFGEWVGSMPDISGNGIPEFIVVQSGVGDPEAVYVFEGGTNDLIDTLAVPNRLRWEINSAIGLPDLDADGFGELAIGVTADDVHKVYIFSGGLLGTESAER